MYIITHASKYIFEPAPHWSVAPSQSGPVGDGRRQPGPLELADLPWPTRTRCGIYIYTYVRVHTWCCSHGYLWLCNAVYIYIHGYTWFDMWWYVMICDEMWWCVMICDDMWCSVSVKRLSHTSGASSIHNLVYKPS